MGTEFAQFREWDYESSLEWFMLDYPMHDSFREYVRSLNEFYLSTPQLYEIDFDSKGFSWISPDEADKNVVAFYRIDKEGNRVIILVNFSGSEQSLTLSVKPCTEVEILFTSEITDSQIVSLPSVTDKEYTAQFTLPKFFGAVFYEKIGKKTIKL